MNKNVGITCLFILSESRRRQSTDTCEKWNISEVMWGWRQSRRTPNKGYDFRVSKQNISLCSKLGFFKVWIFAELPLDCKLWGNFTNRALDFAKHCSPMHPNKSRANFIPSSAQAHFCAVRHLSIVPLGFSGHRFHHWSLSLPLALMHNQLAALWFVCSWHKRMQKFNEGGCSWPLHTSDA